MWNSLREVTAEHVGNSHADTPLPHVTVGFPGIVLTNLSHQYFLIFLLH